MSVIGELLFYSGSGRPDLDDVLRHSASEGLRISVENLRKEAFNRTNEQIANELAVKNEIMPLHVELDKAKPFVKETTVEVTDRFSYVSGGRIPGLEVTKDIPFKGDRQLWHLQPNPWDMNPPRGEVRTGHIRIGISVPSAQSDASMRYLDETIAKIKEYLRLQEVQISQHNSRIAQILISYIQDRRSRVGVASDLLKKLGG